MWCRKNALEWLIESIFILGPAELSSTSITFGVIWYCIISTWIKFLPFVHCLHSPWYHLWRHIFFENCAVVIHKYKILCILFFFAWFRYVDLFWKVSKNDQIRFLKGDSFHRNLLVFLFCFKLVFLYLNVFDNKLFVLH